MIALDALNIIVNYQLQNASSMDLFYLNGVNVHVRKINSFENWNINSMDQDFDFSFESIKKQFCLWLMCDWAGRDNDNETLMGLSSVYYIFNCPHQGKT